LIADLVTLPILAAVGLFAVLAVLVIWVVPKKQASRLAGKPGITVKDLAELENAARGTLVQIVGGVALILTFAATWMQIADNRRATNRALRLNVEQQETQRFNEALKELTSRVSERRLAAVYALTRVGREDVSTQPLIAQVLIAYLHDLHARRGQIPTVSAPCFDTKISDDTQPAIDGILEFAPVTDVIDLSYVDLRRVQLGHKDLRQLQLQGADLSFADLHGSLLDGVPLTNACLTGTRFDNARVPKTNFESANLTLASFLRADLTTARLDQADLTDAALALATLPADNPPAHLDDADLTGADLTNLRSSGRHLAGSWRNLVAHARARQCMLLPWRRTRSAKCAKLIATKYPEPSSTRVE
jgi:uncharacterized protein YjbI with pentapeptide repeats